MIEKKQPPIFIISLKDSARRQKLQQEMENLKLDFEFFDAINGNERHTIFSHYNHKKRMWKKGYAMTSGEIGCFASHYLMWEKCIKLNTPIIVMEDHAQINDNFINVINNFKLIAQRKGFYKLNSTPAKIKLIEKVADNLSIVKFSSKTTMTTGYILMPETAKKLISYAVDWVEPVDDYMDKEWVHHIPKYGIMPFPLKRRDIPSEIGGRERKKMTLLTELRCELIKFPEAVKKFFFLRKI